MCGVATLVNTAAEALAEHFEDQDGLHLILGMLANKDAEACLSALPNLRSAIFVPVEGHACHDPEELVAMADTIGVSAHSARDIPAALSHYADLDPADSAPILIAGSLYLAGEVLRLNNNLPD